MRHHHATFIVVGALALHAGVMGEQAAAATRLATG